MSKTSFSSRVRIALLKGMESIGTSASNLASNAKLKVNEINLETRRREILTDFSLQAFELWQKGVTLPDSLSEMLKELSEIEERLNLLRAQKYAQVSGGDSAAREKTSVPESGASEKTAACVCEAATPEAPMDETPVESPVSSVEIPSSEAPGTLPASEPWGISDESEAPTASETPSASETTPDGEDISKEE